MPLPGRSAPTTGQEERDNKSKTLRWGAGLACVLAIAGCSLNYQSAEVETTATPNIPDTVASGVTYRVVKGSRLSLELEAEQAETYNGRHQTVLTQARFSEYDSKGELDVQGKAGSVVFYTDSQNADISDSVSVSSLSQKGSIAADSLSWQDQTKLLTADPDERIVVKKEDGSYIAGRGFVGDFRRKQVQFDGPVEGAYVYEDKK